MFSEELSGNASRKRQEQARARRRQIKREKGKQEQSKGKNEANNKKTVSKSAYSSSDSGVGNVSSTLNKTYNNKQAIVQATLGKREVRQARQLELCSIIKIQSSIRAYLSKVQAWKAQIEIVGKRLSDLKTLFHILSTKEDYSPPPAMVTVLTHQVLFLVRRHPHHHKYYELSNKVIPVMIHHLIQYALLPGMLSKQEHVDPLLPWLDTHSGRLMFQKLLQLVWYAFSLKDNNNNNLHRVLDKFLRCALAVTPFNDGNNTACQTHARPSILHYTQKYLLLSSEQNIDDNTSSKFVWKPYPTSFHLKLYLPFHIRAMLMERSFENYRDDLGKFSPAISSWERKRNQILLQLTLDVLLQQKQGTFLFVTEILSIPYLTFKISPTAIPLDELLQSIDERQDWNDALPPTSQNCPASMSLLANLITIGKNHPSFQFPKFDYQLATRYFRVLTSLFNIVPSGVFSTRRSAVEWIDDETPIILSEIIKEQCQQIWKDSNYVRMMFQVPASFLRTASDILSQKNEKDIKQEQEFKNTKTMSAASLAAQEAQIDRSKRVWQHSKWAKQLRNKVTSMFSNSTASAKKIGNTPATSQNLKSDVGGGTGVSSSSTPQSSTQTEGSISIWTPEYFSSVCQVFATIISRSSGNDSDCSNQNKHVTSHSNPSILQLLNILCFSTKIIDTSWALIQSNKEMISDIQTLLDPSKRSAPIRSLSLHNLRNNRNDRTQDYGEYKGAVVLFMFVSCLSHVMIITDNVEIYELEKPLPLHQLRRCILLLKKLLYRACFIDENVNKEWQSNHFGISLISASSKAMKDLFDRSSRRPLCVPKMWLVDNLLEKEIKKCKTHDDYLFLLRNTTVLKLCPYLVSFKRRLKLFERIITSSRIDIQGSNEMQNLRPGILVHINRGRVLEDGLQHLNKLGRNLRQRIIVQYLNEAGARESGVDVGGLFKEFWSDLSQLAFDPNYALFRVTEGTTNTLYPNPSSRAAHGSDSIVLFQFLGRILGKALYEGITIQPEFSHFFLSFLRGDYNFLNMLPDLSTIDPTLYDNLMFLKTYEGDARDLSLTFTIGNNDFGNNKEVELISGGNQIDVTNSNKLRYIELVAKYHVCDRVREQSEAFTSGLWDVIDKSWLRIFNEPELQVLISGASEGRIDIQDMKSNTKYTGGYTSLDPTIYRFWKVVSSFDSSKQALLLRFVTSCERAPPLGFAYMNPQLTIQRVSISSDSDKLPSASTCFNILKLPTYSCEAVLRERLLYAIQSGSGFELT